MLIAIQNMTAAEALANLTPYDNTNSNSTSHLFLDIDDGFALKGIFFDDTELNDKKIVSISSGGVNKKTYKATISQAAGAAPVAIVLENTLSADIVWTRTGNGAYNGTLVGEFTANKTFVMLNDVFGGNNTSDSQRFDTDVINVETFTGGLGTDTLLSENAIEVTVYE